MVKFIPEEPKPLAMRICRAKTAIIGAINHALNEEDLPNFLAEGILADIYAQILAQSKIETMREMEAYYKSKASQVDPEQETAEEEQSGF